MIYIQCILTDLCRLVLTLGFIMLLLLGGCKLAYQQEELTCYAKADITKMVVKYNKNAGCMVKTEHGWIDYDKLTYTDYDKLIHVGK